MQFGRLVYVVSHIVGIVGGLWIATDGALYQHSVPETCAGVILVLVVMFSMTMGWR